jgi:hypothetical protein
VRLEVTEPAPLPMGGLSGPERERAWTALSAYVVLKTGEHVEESEIPKRVSEILQNRGHEGFDSEEGMSKQFKRWELPDWILPEVRTRSEPKKKDSRKARRAEGEAEELPPFANAATHLRDTIHTLESPYLEAMLTFKETLQGRYFVGKGETGEPNISEVHGAQWHPHPYEVVLIAVSILERQGNWWHVERLLKELHPRPAEANWQDLVRYIYGRKVDDKGRLLKDEGDGLLDRAKQIATLVRGAVKVKRGVKAPAIPSFDQLKAGWVRTLVDKKGYSREEVAREFREEWERGREEHLQGLHEELEIERTAGNHAMVEEIEREIRIAEAQEYDEDDLDRIWNLAKDLAE